MATVGVQFKDGFNKQVYSYKYDAARVPLRAGDTVVVESPRAGYVTATVINTEAGDRPAAKKRIVCKVDDRDYLALKAKDALDANEEAQIRVRVQNLPKDVLKDLLAQYEDV